MQKFDIAPQHLFRTEASKLIPVFGIELVAIHHLGSISRSDIKVKPVIEIWVEVGDIIQIANIDLLAELSKDELLIDQFTRKMIELGYVPRGEQGLAGRRFFSKHSDPAATYHVHLYQFGHFQPGYQQSPANWGILMQWLAEPEGTFLAPSKAVKTRHTSDSFSFV
ncbi:MAG: GrpB family protein [Anaerolineae bacterium]|nr:GrpB family protein [Anaerolineae bacterium]